MRKNKIEPQTTTIDNETVVIDGECLGAYLSQGGRLCVVNSSCLVIKGTAHFDTDSAERIRRSCNVKSLVTSLRGRK